MTIRLTMWNEGRNEKNEPSVAAIYPDGMDGALAAGLRQRDFAITRVGLDDADQGLPQDLLDRTDVLTWWGGSAHEDVRDEVIDRVQQRVLAGMGLVVLHSGHHSKLFRRMMGTNCNLAWRESPQGELERVWVANPSHPIAAGLPPYFEVPASEMYGEPFDIPTPDEIITISWYRGGEVFRSGLAYHRGLGRIFYFSPGHETYPIYHQPEVRHIIGNGIEWAMRTHVPSRTLENWHRKDPLPL
ncbi:MAG: ThuA domain-containing protein [Devosia sp.]